MDLPCWNSSAVCTLDGAPACNTTLMGHPEGYTIIFSPTETTILGVSAIFLALLGAMANGSLMLSLFLTPRIRALSTTPFIISLCTSDLLFSIYSLPILAAKFLNREEQGKEEEVMCQSWPIILFTLVLSTALIFVLSSVHRAGCLFFRVKVEQIFSNQINIVLVLVCWIICLVSISSVQFYGKVIRWGYTQDCQIVHMKYPKPGPNPMNPLLIVYFSILFLVLLISNAAMMIKIKMETNINYESRKEHMFIFMMLTAFLAWTFSHLPYILVTRLDPCLKHTSLHAVAYILNWLKVVTNPIIFIFMDHGFKKAVYNLASRTTRCASEKSRPNFVTVPSFELEPQKSVRYNRGNTS